MTPHDLIGRQIYSCGGLETVRAAHRVTADNEWSDWHGRATWVLECTCKVTGAGYVAFEDLLLGRALIDPTLAERRAWDRWRNWPDRCEPIPF